MGEEQMYCSQQIVVPAMFPYVLKQYAKAAIRTQPYDLLKWSAAYFTAMANGEEPPVKSRIEYFPKETTSGLTPGYLRVLIKQLGSNETVPRSVLKEKWLGVCLNLNCFEELLMLGNFKKEEINFRHFLAVAAGHLTANLSETMTLLCELLTDEPEGASAMIPAPVFLDLYTYLATLDCGKWDCAARGSVQSDRTDKSEVSVGQTDQSQVSIVEKVDNEKATQANFRRSEVSGIGPVVGTDQRRAVIGYVDWWAERQEGMFGPRNLRHFLCPSLQD